MARAPRIDLRTFQQELASRLATKTAAQVESSRLGLSSGGERWLVRLADAGEVITMPHIVKVPMTREWFLGVANIRGNLFSVVDFAGFMGHASAAASAATRLLLFGPRVGELNAGIVVSRVLGLRNLADLAPGADAGRRSALVRAALDGRRRQRLAGNGSRTARAYSCVPAGRGLAGE